METLKRNLKPFAQRELGSTVKRDVLFCVVGGFIVKQVARVAGVGAAAAADGGGGVCKEFDEVVVGN